MSFMSAVSVISRTSRLGSRSVAESAACTSDDDVRVFELSRGEVDADVQAFGSGIRACPFCEVAACSVEDPAAERDDQAGLLGDRDELIGREHPAGRVLPADEGFEAGRLARYRARRSVGTAGRARGCRRRCAGRSRARSGFGPCRTWTNRKRATWPRPRPWRRTVRRRRCGSGRPRCVVPARRTRHRHWRRRTTDWPSQSNGCATGLDQPVAQCLDFVCARWGLR